MVNGFVFIIESPSEQDILDGRTEGRALCEALGLSGTNARYSIAISKNMFFTAIHQRLLEAYNGFGGKLPILHISAHGNSEGIELSNGDFISWHELRQLLVPLNDAMNGALLICLSSCFGNSGCRMAMYEDEHKPFWALVGHVGSAVWSDAAVAYITFYHNFFKGYSVEASVKAMRIASCDPQFNFSYGAQVRNDWGKFISQPRRDALVAALGGSSTSRNGPSLLDLATRPTTSPQGA